MLKPFPMIDCAPFVESLNGKPVAIFGLGISGLSTVKALKAAGAQIIAWDDANEKRTAALGLEIDVSELDEEILKNCACLILAPGVPLTFPEPHEVVTAARAADIEIICDIEILHRVNQTRNIPRKTIGITGTNGKSTTTALVQHILSECGFPSEMGGNIGRAALDMELPERGGAFILEMSSYQIDLCPNFTPDIAVLLNVTPDHLDRHGSMDGYVEAKARMFEGGGHAIISTDDMYCWEVSEKVKGEGLRELIPLSMDEISAKSLTAPAIRGQHNLQNALAALYVCRLLGIEDEAFMNALQTFPGLNHRQYRVRQIENVLYINDSKATNAEAASKALSAYNDIYWILGGQAKEGGLEGLENMMDRVKRAFVIGEAQEEFSEWLKKQNVPYQLNDSLDQAVTQAHEAAQKNGGGIVLLSPACASWDQFKNFEQRGNVFAKAVESL